MPQLYFAPRKDLLPIVQEPGWAPGPVWTGAENLAPTGIQSPDHPARSKSLYRLSYPAHKYRFCLTIYCISHLFPDHLFTYRHHNVFRILICYGIAEFLNSSFFVRKRRKKSKIVTVTIYPMKPMPITLSVNHRP